jgi:nicotinate-nucleotide adenylyltransferase
MSKNQQKLGFFSGTFDPIHDGHIEAALAAASELDLDKVYFIVDKNPWGTKKPISFTHRQKMAEAAVKRYPKLELLDLKMDKLTIEESLAKLDKLFEGEYYFIVGSDVFLGMNPQTWSGLDQLIAHHLIIFMRSAASLYELKQHALKLKIKPHFFVSPKPHHNSTDVRLSLKGKTYWLPKEVAEYININQLYAADSSKLS